MTKYRGGDTVKKGNYWSFSAGEMVQLEAEGVLPGDSEKQYYRAPAGIILLVVAPILGLVYAAFLPVAAVAIPLFTLGKKMLAAIPVRQGDGDGFRWHRNTPHFSGKKDA